MTGTLLAVGSLVGAGGVGVFSTFYKVCKPSQILVRTGLGIKQMAISQSGFVWPFQQRKGSEEGTKEWSNMISRHLPLEGAYHVRV